MWVSSTPHQRTCSQQSLCGRLFSTLRLLVKGIFGTIYWQPRVVVGVMLVLFPTRLMGGNPASSSAEIRPQSYFLRTSSIQLRFFLAQRYHGYHCLHERAAVLRHFHPFHSLYIISVKQPTVIHPPNRQRSPTLLVRKAVQHLGRALGDGTPRRDNAHLPRTMSGNVSGVYTITLSHLSTVQALLHDWN